MASIIIKLSDQMNHQDLNRLRTQIVKNLLKQNIHVITSYTDIMCQVDTVASQSDMTTPGVSGAT